LDAQDCETGLTSVTTAFAGLMGPTQSSRPDSFSVFGRSNPELVLGNIYRTEFLPHKDTPSPLQKPTSYCCLDKQS